MNSFKSVFQAVATATVLCQIALVPALAQTTPTARPAREPVPTTSTASPTLSFSCEQYSGKPATLLYVNGEIRGPLVVWTTDYFGSNYTPQERCETVTDRMNSAVAQNGGSWHGFRFAIGPLNNQSVLCFVRSSERCNNTNMLFTLKPENARNPREVLTRLTNVARLGSGSPVYESGGVDEGEEDLSVSLEDMVNQALQNPASSSSGTPPDATTNPAVSTPQSEPSDPGYLSDPVYYP